MKSSVTASDGKLITKYVNIADLNSSTIDMEKYQYPFFQAMPIALDS